MIFPGKYGRWHGPHTAVTETLAPCLPSAARAAANGNVSSAQEPQALRSAGTRYVGMATVVRGAAGLIRGGDSKPPGGELVERRVNAKFGFNKFGTQFRIAQFRSALIRNVPSFYQLCLMCGVL